MQNEKVKIKKKYDFLSNYVKTHRFILKIQKIRLRGNNETTIYRRKSGGINLNLNQEQANRK